MVQNEVDKFSIDIHSKFDITLNQPSNVILSPIFKRWLYFLKRRFRFLYSLLTYSFTNFFVVP